MSIYFIQNINNNNKLSFPFFKKKLKTPSYNSLII